VFEDEKGNDLRGLAEIIIAKHRNGAVGDVRLRFRGEFVRFQNMDDETSVDISDPNMPIMMGSNPGGSDAGSGVQTLGSRMNAGYPATPPLIATPLAGGAGMGAPLSQPGGMGASMLQPGGNDDVPF
jgi:hypothetical protein